MLRMPTNLTYSRCGQASRRGGLCNQLLTLKGLGKTNIKETVGGVENPKGE